MRKKNRILNGVGIRSTFICTHTHHDFHVLNCEMIIIYFSNKIHQHEKKNEFQWLVRPLGCKATRLSVESDVWNAPAYTNHTINDTKEI